MGVFLIERSNILEQRCKKITGFASSEVLGKKMEDFTIFGIYLKKKNKILKNSLSIPRKKVFNKKKGKIL